MNLEIQITRFNINSPTQRVGIEPSKAFRTIQSQNRPTVLIQCIQQNGP